MTHVLRGLDQVAWLAQNLSVLFAVVLGLVQVGDMVEMEALGVYPWVGVVSEGVALGASPFCLCPLPQPAGL